MKVSRDTLEAMRFDLNQALAAVAKRFECSLKLGNGTFNPNVGVFSFKIEGSGSANSNGYEREASLYQSLQQAYSLPALGSEFQTFDGHRYTTFGMRSRSYKVLAKRLDNGKMYLFKAEAVAQYVKAFAAKKVSKPK